MIYEEFILDFLYKDFKENDTIHYRAYFIVQDEGSGSSCGRCKLESICNKDFTKYGIAIKVGSKWENWIDFLCKDTKISEECICTELEIIHKINSSENYIISKPEEVEPITPEDIIDEFCKKFCPLHTESLKCRDSKECPFHKLFNKSGTYIIHLPDDK